MDITLIKKLRTDTGLSMKDCTKAAKETDNYDEAILYLRQRNKDLLERRSDRETSNGTTAIYQGKDGATLILLGCETDFVSGNAEFKEAATNIAEALHNLSTEENVNEMLQEMGGQFGENVKLLDEKRVHVDNPDHDVVGLYNHGNIATAVVISGTEDQARQLAMHIAASAPLPKALAEYELDADFVAQERALVEASDDVQGKPEHIQGKIIDGKMKKVFKQYCLLDQEVLFECEGKQSVGKWCETNNVKVLFFDLVSMR